MAILAPTSRFRSVDFPAFGLPSNETNPALCGTSAGSAMQQPLPQARRRPREDVALAAVHEVGLHGIAVVPAHEMKRTVRDQQIELEREGHADLPGLAPGRGCRGH